MAFWWKMIFCCNHLWRVGKGIFYHFVKIIYQACNIFLLLLLCQHACGVETIWWCVGDGFKFRRSVRSELGSSAVQLIWWCHLHAKLEEILEGNKTNGECDLKNDWLLVNSWTEINVIHMVTSVSGSTYSLIRLSSDRVIWLALRCFRMIGIPDLLNGVI